MTQDCKRNYFNVSLFFCVMGNEIRGFEVDSSFSNETKGRNDDKHSPITGAMRYMKSRRRRRRKKIRLHKPQNCFIHSSSDFNRGSNILKIVNVYLFSRKKAHCIIMKQICVILIYSL